MFGFINIFKPEGMTSFDVVAKLRKVTHIKQIGHTGTLDPFAIGVLPISIGKATKLIEYLPDDKAYIATVQFGADTDTYDKDGKIIKTYDKKITENDVKNILNDFRGEISQLPPIYSAIKINGKKLYEYAREGKQAEIKPRKVFISNIELMSFDKDKQSAQIKVECSKGTYIRSIAYDIGQKLNCGGYLTALERTKAGAFNLETSVKLDEIKTIEDVEKKIINPIDVLINDKYELSDIEREKVLHGNEITPRQEFQHSKETKDNNIVILVYGGKIIAVGFRDKNKIKIKKVLEVL
ncbi:MAG TPA: tRNA pseudouridine(55) synthase TruB [Cyanobacteria bacterium UBA11991]|nr:tRNA pseudouridine(55) synthase TruB [Cyanobacteriota bacterium]MDY6359089.1 tRNA pseudouridine(55) synthase TruB [Cyanobacteriota bacterium]MDY6364485.1 tRNA pseudouridine(55) synthase TruB [Cyanobacteriota bacterium]HCB11007.1 tRNA pseudouridine(55) synthase TruB [Cyanobacteria bacterium UBA11991]